MKYMNSRRVPPEPEESKKTKEELEEFVEEVALAGETLRKLREINKMTITELADQIHLDPQLLAKMENGEQHIPMAVAKQLSDIFHVDYKNFT